MNVDNISATINSIPSKYKSVSGNIGSSAIKKAYQAGNFIKSNASANTQQHIDTFTKTVKENTPDSIKKNKKSIIGTGIIIGAFLSACAIAKTITNTIKEIKNKINKPVQSEKISLHQG